MPTPFQTSRLVEFHDTDMAGIMHFSAYFQYMESAEHELLRSLGMSVQMQLGDELISFPRVSATCDFQSPARFEQMLDIAVSLERLGTKSLTFIYRFTHQGAVVAIGKMTSVCCRIESDAPPRSRPIPPEVAERLSSLVA